MSGNRRLRIAEILEDITEAAAYFDYVINALSS
jgi:hypothetical protein